MPRSACVYQREREKIIEIFPRRQHIPLSIFEDTHSSHTYTMDLSVSHCLDITANHSKSQQRSQQITANIQSRVVPLPASETCLGTTVLACVCQCCPSACRDGASAAARGPVSSRARSISHSPLHPAQDCVAYRCNIPVPIPGFLVLLPAAVGIPSVPGSETAAGVRNKQTRCITHANAPSLARKSTDGMLQGDRESFGAWPPSAWEHTIAPSFCARRRCVILKGSRIISEPLYTDNARTQAARVLGSE